MWMWPFRKKLPKQYCLTTLNFPYDDSIIFKQEIKCEVLEDYGEVVNRILAEYIDPRDGEVIVQVLTRSLCTFLPMEDFKKPKVSCETI